MAIKVDAAAAAPNAGPCSTLMKNRMGPVTTGNADNQPATDGPQMRPATLIPQINSGTSVNFRSSSNDVNQRSTS